MNKGSSLLSREKIEIIDIDDAHESQTEEHDLIAGHMEDDAHDHGS
jgi:hypothetical protein